MGALTALAADGGGAQKSLPHLMGLFTSLDCGKRGDVC